MQWQCCVARINPNRYANNGGGGMTMKKKVGARISSNRIFSLNGTNNHTYIGNPNSAFNRNIDAPGQDSCCNVSDTNYVKTSVKNYSGYMHQKTEVVNSFECYKKVNKALVDKYDADKVGLNKHFTVNNKDQSSRIELLKARCSAQLDRSNYAEELKNKNNSLCSGTKNSLCNITKDLPAVNAYVPGYDIFLLSRKRGCNYNPPDAKIIAC